MIARDRWHIEAAGGVATFCKRASFCIVLRPADHSAAKIADTETTHVGRWLGLGKCAHWLIFAQRAN